MDRGMCEAWRDEIDKLLIFVSEFKWSSFEAPSHDYRLVFSQQS